MKVITHKDNASAKVYASSIQNMAFEVHVFTYNENLRQQCSYIGQWIVSPSPETYDDRGNPLVDKVYRPINRSTELNLMNEDLIQVIDECGHQIMLHTGPLLETVIGINSSTPRWHQAESTVLRRKIT